MYHSPNELGRKNGPQETMKNRLFFKHRLKMQESRGIYPVLFRNAL